MWLRICILAFIDRRSLGLNLRKMTKAKWGGSSYLFISKLRSYIIHNMPNTRKPYEPHPFSCIIWRTKSLLFGAKLGPKGQNEEEIDTTRSKWGQSDVEAKFYS